MDEALYGADGYYAVRPRLGGPGADYATSPEVHPVFGALLGRHVWRLWMALGRPSRFDLVEEGPGNGSLCRDLLLWARHEEPDFAEAMRYILIEPSGPLRARQEAVLATSGLLDERISWVNASALDFARPVDGCVLANELVDAFPVHLVAVRAGRLLERFVTLADDGTGFAFEEAAPSTPDLEAYFQRLGLLPGEGSVAEVNLRAIAWAAHTADLLTRGGVVVLDYGYPADQLFSPGRRHGTLLCYREHGLSSDPLAHVGRQDITSHVDFTSLAHAGEKRGLHTAGLLDQATFLRNLGLPAYVSLLDQQPLPAGEHEANRRAMLELVDPAGLGAVKVLVQTRGLAQSAPGEFTGRLPARPPRWLPLLGAEHPRRPSPWEMEGILDVDAQWRELWDGEGEC